MSFLRDLKEGQEYEKYASKKIKKLFNVKIKEFNNDYRYDFIDTNEIKYEVKYDRRSNETGNFFIEYVSKDKPSGIGNTESDNYIFMVNKKEGYMVSTTDLKQLIEDKKYKKNIMCYLEGKKVGGYLFDKEFIINNSIKI